MKKRNGNKNVNHANIVRAMNRFGAAHLILVDVQWMWRMEGKSDDEEQQQKSKWES